MRLGGRKDVQNNFGRGGGYDRRFDSYGGRRPG
jgi:hypothetical protein